MRHTGDWLPDLPAGWAKGALRWQANVYSGGTPSREVAAYWTDGTIPWLASGAVNQWVITEPSEFITERGLSESSAQWVPAEAVVMGLAGQGKTKGMVARTEIRATCNQSMCAIVPEAGRLEHRFLHFWLSVNHDNIRNLAGGDKRDGLNHEHVRSIVVPLPPLALQSRIADYLDRETAEIDTMDAELDRLVETLRERRLSAILGRVRLGDAQPHGRVGPLQMVAEFVAGAGFPNDEQGREDQELPFYKVNALSRADADGVIRFQDHTISPATANRLRADVVPAGSSVLAKIGAALMLGRVRTLGQRGCIDNNMLALVPGSDLEPRYLFWVLHALDMNLIVNPSTIPFLNERALRQFQIPVPTLPEQRRIAAELDAQTARIDDMIADANRLKALLAERRSTLITDVVTGAKEVPA